MQMQPIATDAAHSVVRVQKVAETDCEPIWGLTYPRNHVLNGGGDPSWEGAAVRGD